MRRIIQRVCIFYCNLNINAVIRKRLIRRRCSREKRRPYSLPGGKARKGKNGSTRLNQERHHWLLSEAVAVSGRAILLSSIKRHCTSVEAPNDNQPSANEVTWAENVNPLTRHKSEIKPNNE